MIHLYYSNHLSQLFHEICRSFERTLKQARPLSPVPVILPNNDMGRWLQIELARKFGVSANLQLEMPSSYMHLFYEKIDPDYQNHLAEKEDLTWIIFEILNNPSPELPEFETVLSYIHAGEQQEWPLRRMQLATRIADVFDQYLLYRPEWMRQWKHGTLPDDCRGIPHARWQMGLWHHIYQTHPELTNRADLQHRLMHKIKAGSVDSFLPDDLYLFGVPLMPPVFIQTFMEMANRGCRLHWSHILPCELHSGDPKEDHPLVFNLSKEYRESVHLMNDMVEYTGVEVTRQVQLIKPDKPDTLLSRLQRELTDNRVYEPQVVSGNDTSLRIHSCHNPIREAEVVYDQMLDFLNKNPGKGPADVLVMVPDLQTYAPSIEAVFSSPEDTGHHIPYTLSDPLSGLEIELGDLLVRILRTASGRFRITEIMELLDSPLLRRKLGFSETDISAIEKWVTETYIKWGWDTEQHRGYQNSWQFGIDRMFTGIAGGPSQTGDNALIHGILPYDEIEGGGNIHLLGIFRGFLEQLHHTAEFMKNDHLAETWSEYLESLIIKLFPEDEQTAGVIRQIRSHITALKEIPHKWGVNTHFSSDLIIDWLNSRLESGRVGPGYKGGRVTVSTMVPVRNLPFECIFIMGMNDQQIPGRDSYIGFDLMGQNHRKGDRSRRAQDRAIFMDSIMAAGSQLHMTYTGQNQKDNSVIPPSSLITELLEHLDSYYQIDQAKPSEALVLHHSLFGFNTRYFDPDYPDFFTYSSLHSEIAARGTDTDRNVWFPADQPVERDDKHQISEVSLPELIRFLQRPVAYFLRERLGITLLQEEVISEDRDHWQISGLSGYRIRNELLQTILAEKEPASVYTYFSAEGSMPSGEVGKYHFENVSAELREYLEQIKKQVHIQPFMEPVEFDREFDVDGQQIRLYGKLDHITKAGNLFLLTNKENPKYTLMAWVHHLALNLLDISGVQNKTALAMRPHSGKKFNSHIFAEIESPEKRLQELLRRFIEGLQQPDPVYPKSGEAYASELQKNNDSLQAAKKAENEFYGGYKNYPDINDDPALAYLYSDESPLKQPGYYKQVLNLWEPILKNMKQPDE